MQKVLTPDEMRFVDAHFIHEKNIPGLVLMEHAALGVTEAVLRCRPDNVVILCGPGNNGGDGLAVLRQLSMRKVAAKAYILSRVDGLSIDAKAQYDMAASCGLNIDFLLDEAAVEMVDLSSADIIVDALFGTGFSGQLTGRFLRIIERVNGLSKPVIAVDISSGVNGATGDVHDEAIYAKETVTFQYVKRGHLLTPGRMYTGTLTIAPIAPYVDEPKNNLEMWEHEDVAALLPERPMDCHKGSNGRALLLVGSADYTGAAIMSARSALRAGVGLLHVGLPVGCVYAMTECPGAIAHPLGKGKQWSIEAAEQAIPLLSKAEVIAIGPGMGAGEGVAPILRAALETKKPLVIDADGLNALSCSRGLVDLLHTNVILTPHYKEMARLLQNDKDRKQAKDEQAIPELVQCASAAAVRWGCTVLLKGATSVIASNNRAALNTTGNTGLAKAGSGDVLTGIILALLAQGIKPYEAACVGAYLLGASAEKAFSLLLTRALMPTDVISALSFE